MGWRGESRRHSLARKGVSTVIDQDRRFDVSNFVANGYEGFGDIIHSQEYEGLDGFYHIIVNKDGSYRLQTPSGLEFGQFDKEGYSHRAKYQESDIEEWINSVGTDLVNNEEHDFKASGKSWATGDPSFDKEFITMQEQEADKQEESIAKARRGQVKGRKTYTIGESTRKARNPSHEAYLGLLKAYEGIGNTQGEANKVASFRYFDHRDGHVREDEYEIDKKGNYKYIKSVDLGKAT